MAVTLSDVKTGLCITDNYRDEELQIYMEDVIDTLKGAGVPESRITKGVVVIGVRDLFYGGEGGTKFSEYFRQRAAQLAIRGQ
jgi:hypothetical protein